MIRQWEAQRLSDHMLRSLVFFMASANPHAHSMHLQTAMVGLTRTTLPELGSVRAALRHSHAK